MNIVLNKISGKCAELVDYLSGLPDIGLYLAVSQQDTLRIIHANQPDAVIFCLSHLKPDGFIKSLYHDYPTLQIYLYTLEGGELSGMELMDLRTLESIRLEQLLPSSGGQPATHSQIQLKIDKSNSKE